MAALYLFAFFVPYGVFSIPSGVAEYESLWRKTRLNISCNFCVSFFGAIYFPMYPNFPCSAGIPIFNRLWNKADVTSGHKSIASGCRW